MNKTQGVVRFISGNMISVEFDGDVLQNEVGYAFLEGKTRLKSEVVRVRKNIADLQVYEETSGLKVGDKVEFSGELLSVELGPGLLSQIYDGLQNPLVHIADEYGFFLPRGVFKNALDMKKTWEFNPLCKAGDVVTGGDFLGRVPEGIFDHKVMVPFYLKGKYKIEKIVPKGKYKVNDKIAKVKDEDGNELDLTMMFEWPVKLPVKAYKEKLAPSETLVTKIRLIDTFSPVNKGGTYCIPGPFGAGKTVLQQITSRHAEVDIVIIAACGERAGEVVETLREFPKLTDPRTGKSLMERTVIICNTSSMPVAARESSVYTAITIAEYYRQMGLNVLLLADSTSRWAQAMRELSGRLEEIPGEEAYPAYLESRIAEFYERAGSVKLNNNENGTLTIGGTVSPAGGNFEEPVTQSTLKVVGAFHGLSRDRANARKFPSVDPLESWSKYKSFVDEGLVAYAKNILFRGNEVKQMMTVVGEEGTSIDDFIIYLKSEFLDDVYIQQNGFDPVDASTTADRQKYMFAKVVDVLKKKFSFEDKEKARVSFYELRQLFIDWNYMPFNSDEFIKKEKEINTKLEEKK
ncbi:MAG: V-type ATP synthase subunit A [Endomicrobiales bacterium]|nr:V-type ATP synthase subunit A [Endomicrobiales bacterium]